jgi:hypothetical protein
MLQVHNNVWQDTPGALSGTVLVVQLRCTWACNKSLHKSNGCLKLSKVNVSCLLAILSPKIINGIEILGRVLWLSGSMDAINGTCGFGRDVATSLHCSKNAAQGSQSYSAETDMLQVILEISP